MKSIWLCFLVFLCFQGAAQEKILKYNPDTVRSFSGKILKIEEQNLYGKGKNFLFVVVPEKNLPAIVVDGGLCSLYKKKPVVGKQIKVTGSFVKTDKREIVLSRSIIVDKKIISIRLDNGVPVWIHRKNSGSGSRGRHSFIYRRMRHGRH